MLRPDPPKAGAGAVIIGLTVVYGFVVGTAFGLFLGWLIF